MNKKTLIIPNSWPLHSECNDFPPFSVFPLKENQRMGGWCRLNANFQNIFNKIFLDWPIEKTLHCIYSENVHYLNKIVWAYYRTLSTLKSLDLKKNKKKTGIYHGTASPWESRAGVLLYLISIEYWNFTAVLTTNSIVQYD